MAPIREDARYVYDPAVLTAGASLGTPAAFAYLDGLSNPRGVWCALDNQFYAGSWDVTVRVQGNPLRAMRTILEAAAQSTEFAGGGVSVRQTFFLPYLPETDGTARTSLQAGLMLLEFHNQTDGARDVEIEHLLVFPAVPSGLFTKQPPESQTRKSVHCRPVDTGIVAETIGRPGEVRVFGSPDGLDAMRYDERTVRTTSRRTLQAGQQTTVPFVLAFSPKGEGEALGISRHMQQVEEILRKTRSALARALEDARVLTPDPLINRGIFWSKVNTLRVQHQYRSGPGFTNDPPQDIVVIRDLAWFVFGADYLTPQFVRGALGTALAVARHEGGKLTEYYHADEEVPEKHDYRLNINDDTPLFVIALWHHLLLHGSREQMESWYPAIRDAAGWIISQGKDDLVWCHAGGTNVWGICSWRNIIDGYNLTGAVTEVNAECAAALRIASAAARWLEHGEDARRFDAAALAMREAINRDLVSDRTGLYALAKENTGSLRHDVTGDLVFPVLFDVAGDAMRARILERLLQPDLWTEGGLRTVPPGEPEFDPDASYQLVGGVWPNLTAWLAWCLRKERPEITAEAMRRIYEISEAEDPSSRGFVVPGEFPERLHGTTFKSRGMAMSPWMPPTYLWLAVEGLLGVSPARHSISVMPNIPGSWGWIGAKNLPLRGANIDLFFHDGTVYTTAPFITTAHALVSGEPVPARADLPGTFAMALRSDGHLYVCMGADREASGRVFVGFPQGEFQIPFSLPAGGALVMRDPAEVVSAGEPVAPPQGGGRKGS